MCVPSGKATKKKLANKKKKSSTLLAFFFHFPSCIVIHFCSLIEYTCIMLFVQHSKRRKYLTVSLIFILKRIPFFHQPSYSSFLTLSSSFLFWSTCSNYRNFHFNEHANVLSIMQTRNYHDV